MKEEELASLRANMEERLEEEVRVRQQATHNLELKLSELREQCSDLQDQLDRAEASKQTALKDLSDQLTRSYKTELEGLRSRFRLMATTSMERSPSDGSLEKIEVCHTVRQWRRFFCPNNRYLKLVVLLE
jgi:RB1-inducible coiled-coil protein 1